ncbi:hypothetical protein MBBAR_1c02290 [Methanobrevibacter arboriphilus JCM 13429 = DSM 1125]|uniref:Uncharacterized protein n=1 Tax=Methanobrevibacter arboriphilus JCM 13429 = DSM 1125 TaxID=1300164 RepID=A0A1V6N564_METAZ|nr:hypothetical protein MBBAR_1c02290 [Methanobrevibacter arboriphilus JCM 13429 = DSM 1125]
MIINFLNIQIFFFNNFPFFMLINDAILYSNYLFKDENNFLALNQIFSKTSFPSSVILLSKIFFERFSLIVIMQFNIVIKFQLNYFTLSLIIIPSLDASISVKGP